MALGGAVRTAKTVKDLIVPILVLCLGLLFALTYCGNPSSSNSGGSSAAQSVIPSTSASHSDGLKTIAYADLPPQGRTTLQLIAQGGPYPYPRNDNVVFANRERILPKQASGFYREYTVPTPGSSTRGAKRIIKAKDGTLYYTDDHYNSFRRIIR